ncbi:ATPase ASNA1-like protein 2-like [Chlorella sorokiniana]|uniref:ATPase ASNA1-like protein 2-like n=1 Tax=Chlorella sorokiniana TaxID=3076 RepID=A0A2P6TQD2_CHLSO|nr:ATPase ASNA1-like protein 2-like [Chlorella sorokiniana]|eukprot:PRW56240.1 ATPase ASNA1-like protein 2-like [Chlorella sorokiniana]
MASRTQQPCSALCARQSLQPVPRAWPAARPFSAGQRQAVAPPPAAAAPGRRRQPAPIRAAAAEVVTGETPFDELCAGTDRKYIMVSGKGGVGKTSLAASLAVRFAQAGHTTLVVSTDPAHSLGDSLAQDLSGGVPILVEGTDLPLWGMEIDTEREKERFKAWSAGKGKEEAKDFMGGFGLGSVVEQLADLKLGELLDSPPPGFDEAVAISKVLQFVKGEEYARFTRIVFDTAPTGHTLRLLTVPDFVEASLAKITRLRRKLSSASQTIRGLFGADGSQDEAVDKLEQLQDSIRLVKALFRDQQATEFIIATIPTVLGVNESGRLIRALRKERIPCRRIVVNQIIGAGMGTKYLQMKEKDQERALAMIDEDPGLHGLRHLRAPYLDMEVRGVPALSYFGQQVWGGVVDDLAAGQGRKYFLLGGKGGVGKTSCSSSLAVALASAGHTTLVVSTDPAHSLSDSLDQDVSGGRPVEVQGTNGQVYGMEIDLELARQELRELSGQDEGRKLDDILGSVGLAGVADQLKDLRLGELLDTPPPGVDEAIAIAKVIQFLKDPEYARFTRIVFDTAPTGHTLRLLALPDFLDTSVGKILRLRQKIMSVKDSVTGFFSGSSEKDASSEKLDAFKDYMAEARNVFRNPSTTEFVIVTIPTAMAAAESIRLAKALQKEQVPIRTLVVNQLLPPGLQDKYLQTRRADQQRALQRLRADPELGQLQLIEAPLFDLEVRGVPALTYFGQQVWR